MNEFKQRRILIGVGGGIAAYKLCEVVSTLAKADAQVRVILTASAQQFITPLTFATLSRHAVYTDADFWQPHPRPLHIDLGEWAELFVIAPLTAHTLAKLSYGLADNLLTNTVLASACPVLVAPAMNTDMWEQETVQRNWQNLQTFPRLHTLGPADGRLACDRVGTGRIVEPPDILANIASLLHTQGRRDLLGKRILISAASTREYLDPVRFIGNPSTGKMGLAIAQAAQHRGAEVTLVHGPVEWPVPIGLQDIPVTSAAQMQAALQNHMPQTDWLIMAAAVADVKPAHFSAEKYPKRSLPSSLPLDPVPDIVAKLSELKQPHQKIIGFAAQTGDILSPAQDKLMRKNLDAIVANPIDQAGVGFGSLFNEAIFIDRQGRQVQVPRCSKLQLAHQLLDFIDSMEDL